MHATCLLQVIFAPAIRSRALPAARCTSAAPQREAELVVRLFSALSHLSLGPSPDLHKEATAEPAAAQAAAPAAPAAAGVVLAAASATSSKPSAHSHAHGHAPDEGAAAFVGDGSAVHLADMQALCGALQLPEDWREVRARFKRARNAELLEPLDETEEDGKGADAVLLDNMQLSERLGAKEHGGGGGTSAGSSRRSSLVLMGAARRREHEQAIAEAEEFGRKTGRRNFGSSEIDMIFGTAAAGVKRRAEQRMADANEGASKPTAADRPPKAYHGSEARRLSRVAMATVAAPTAKADEEDEEAPMATAAEAAAAVASGDGRDACTLDRPAFLIFLVLTAAAKYGRSRPIEPPADAASQAKPDRIARTAVRAAAAARDGGTGVAHAVRLLLAANVRRFAPRLAVLPCDEFREVQLYTESTERALGEKRGLLYGLFAEHAHGMRGARGAAAAAGESGARMTVGEWLGMWDRLALYDSRFTQEHARLCAAHSKVSAKPCPRSATVCSVPASLTCYHAAHSLAPSLSRSRPLCSDRCH